METLAHYGACVLKSVQCAIQYSMSNITPLHPGGLVDIDIKDMKGAIRAVYLMDKDALLNSLSPSNIQQVDANGETALAWAVSMPWLAGVEILCEAGADLNAQNNLGETVLYLSRNEQGSESEAILDFLLERGANPNIASLDGATPLDLAARMGQTQAVRSLLKYGANPNFDLTNDHDYDNENYSPGGLPLQQACLGGHVDIIDILLKAGAGPAYPDFSGMTTIDYVRDILPGLVPRLLATQAHSEDPLPLVRIEDLSLILDRIQDRPNPARRELKLVR